MRRYSLEHRHSCSLVRRYGLVRRYSYSFVRRSSLVHRYSCSLVRRYSLERRYSLVHRYICSLVRRYSLVCRYNLVHRYSYSLVRLYSFPSHMWINRATLPLPSEQKELPLLPTLGYIYIYIYILSTALWPVPSRLPSTVVTPDTRSALRTSHLPSISAPAYCRGPLSYLFYVCLEYYVQYTFLFINSTTLKYLRDAL